MTTIVHRSDPEGSYAYVLNASKHGQITEKQYRYMLAELPPHFPVPAICLTVIIEDAFCCIFDNTNKTCVLAVEQPGYQPFGDGLY